MALGSLATAGFWGFYILARRLGSGRLIGGAFSYVFAFGSLWLMKLGHGQTYTVMLAPSVGVMALAALRRAGLSAVPWAVASGGLLGLIFLTAPQTGWFLCFDLLVLAGITLALALRTGEAWRFIARHAMRYAPAMTAWSSVLVICLLVVLNVYATTTARGWSWDYVRPSLPLWTDILNVQPGNMIWHRLLYLAWIADHQESRQPEHALGYTPVVFCCALVFIVALLRGPWRHPADRLALTCLLVPLVIAVFQLDIDDYLIWHVIYHFVPASNGIRVPFRIQITAAPFLFLGLALAFTRLIARTQGRWPRWMLAFAVAFCVAEQANNALPSRDTPAAMATLERVAPRPPGCDVFYLTPQPGVPPDRWPERQASAMVLSQTLGMPTVNGNSSWLPPGWDLFWPDEPGYAAKLRAWIADHPSGVSFCGLNTAPGSGRTGCRRGADVSRAATASG